MKKRQRLKGKGKNIDRGFTMIELLVVIAIVGILGAIAAPSWLAFTRQQRVSAVNDEIFRAINEAKTDAKVTKRDYSVSFRVNGDGVAQIAIHRASIKPAPDPSDPDAEVLSDEAWKDLGADLQVKPDQILLFTNMELGGVNTITSGAIGPGVYPQPTESDPITIEFDQYGNLDPLTNPDLGNIDVPEQYGLIIAVGVPSSDGDTAIDSTNRCVFVKTLLGAMQTRQGEECRPGS